MQEALESFEEMLATCAAIAYGRGHPFVRIGAIKTASTVEQARIKLLKEVGVLPSDLGQFAVERDLVATADQIVDVLDRHGVSERVQRAILDVVDPPASRRRSSQVSANSQT